MLTRARRRAANGRRWQLNAEAGPPNLCIHLGEVSLNAAVGTDPDVRTFKLDAYTGGKVWLAGFQDPVVFELASMWTTPGEQLALLLDHDPANSLGHVDKFKIHASKIDGLGITSIPGKPRDRVLRAVDNGKVWQLSVGGSALANDIHWIEDGIELVVNGQTLQGPFWLATNYHLREITFTAAGADAGGAVATLAASLSKGTQPMKTFLQWLKAQNKDIETLNANELGTLKTQYAQWKAQMEQLQRGELVGNDGATSAGDSLLGGAGDDTTQAAAGADTLEPAAAADTLQAAASADTTQAAAAPDTIIQPAAVGAGTPTAHGAGDQRAAADAAHEIRSHEMRTLNAQFSAPMCRVVGGQSSDVRGARLLTPEDGEHSGSREVPLLAYAYSNGWTADRFELEAMRRSFPTAPERHAQGNQSDNQRVEMLASLTAGMLNHARFPLDNLTVGQSQVGRRELNASFRQDPNSDTRQRWMEGAQRFAGMTLDQYVAEAAKLDPNKPIDLVASYGHAWRNNPVALQAAFSSMSVMDMFTQNMTALLLQMYTQENNELFPMARRRPVKNFLLQERKRMELAGNDMELLLPTETASDMTMSSTGEEYRISRFAKKMLINEETLINERWDEIEDGPRFMGMAAARLVPELILSILLGNPNMKDGQPFISAAAGNLRTGQPFTATSLETGTTAFSLQQENGVTLNLEASGLFHSVTSQWAVRRTLAAAALIAGGGTTGTVTSENVLANLVTPVKDARLDNGFKDPQNRKVTVAGEPASWWLFSTQFESLEYGFLEGTDGMIQINRWVEDKGQWGIGFAGKQDGGCAPMRRATIQKNEG